MNEFLDQKDGGTAILSHFYLLTGCAGSLWLEGYVFLINAFVAVRLQLLHFTDHHLFFCSREYWCSVSAMLWWVFTGYPYFRDADIRRQASIIGKRVGVHRWSPTTTKTLEGSFAFTLSVVISAWILRLFGVTESFSVSFCDFNH